MKVKLQTNAHYLASFTEQFFPSENSHTHSRCEEIMTNIQAQTTSCASVVLQAAAEGAFTSSQSIVETLRSTIENSRNIVMQELVSHCSARLQEIFFSLRFFFTNSHIVTLFYSVSV